jgi:hypothetical protein
LIRQWHGPYSMDMLVILMIGWLDKLDTLLTYIVNCDENCNNAGMWNEDTPCVVIQNVGGTKEEENLY